MKFRKVSFPRGNYIVPEIGNVSRIRKCQLTYFLRTAQGIFGEKGQSFPRIALCSNILSYVDSVLAWNIDLIEAGREKAVNAIQLYAEDRSGFFNLVEETFCTGVDVIKDACSTTLGLLEDTDEAHCESYSRILKVSEIFGLRHDEVELLVFLYSFSTSSELREFFDQVSTHTGIEKGDLLAFSMAMDRPHLIRLLLGGGRMVDNLLIESQDSFSALFMARRVLSPWMVRVCEGVFGDESDIERLFFNDEENSEYTLDDFEHVANDTAIVSRLLTRALDAKAKGINVLIIGSEASGKHDYATILANRAGTARRVNTASGVDMFESTLGMTIPYLASHYAPGSDSVIVFDGLNLLNSREQWKFRFADEQFLKSAFGVRSFPNTDMLTRWMSNALEHNPRPAIWLCSEETDLEREILSRFSLIINLPTLPAETLWAKSLRSATEYISDSEIKRLMASKIDLTLIKSGIKAIDLFKPDAGKAEEFMRMHILRASTLGGMGNTGRENQHADFHLEFCNLRGRVRIERMISGLQANAIQRVLLHGAPGTGKTMLAQHIAKCLQKPLMSRKYSDIQSKYLGEGEAKLAMAFRDAKASGSILFIDEVDSFLLDRSSIPDSAPWLRSFVNEFLQQMDQFDGLLLCATNFLESLDSAVLRRFSLKLGFDYMTSEQTGKLFARTFKLSSVDDIEQSIRRRLNVMKFLTPGDFSVVTERAKLLELFSQDDFLNFLEEEHVLKSERLENRPIGFVYS